MRKIFLLIILLISCLFLSACSSNNLEENLLGINFDVDTNESSEFDYDTKNPTVAMYIKNYGAIVIELYPDIAPNTVNNFISLVSKGFYDHNSFHCLVPGFVLQGGDPNGNGTGGPGYTIDGEFNRNDFKNDLKHTKGVVSMARSTGLNTAGSQFFIVHKDATYLDGQYASFGETVSGIEVVDKIAKVRTTPNDRPYEDVIIESIKISEE